MADTPTIPMPKSREQVEFRPATHELFLAFNSDWHAFAFDDWIHEEGWELFCKWAAENAQEYKH